MYQNPFYDQGWTYTVPYVTWTTGIGYRRDHITDDEMAAKGYNILWDPQYYGKTAFYDDYRTALGMALLRNGVEDVNTGNEKDIKAAADALLALLDAHERSHRDQQRVRAPSRRRHLGRPGVVRRHGGGEVLPAEGREHRCPRLLVSGSPGTEPSTTTSITIPATAQNPVPSPTPS